MLCRLHPRKGKIYILNAARRTLYGSTTFCLPSRFLSDVPDDLIPRFDHGEDTSYLYGSYSYKDYVRDTPARISGAGGGISALRVESGQSAGPARWQQGDIVTHNVFGKGEILSVLPMGNDYLLEIRFEKLGVKKLWQITQSCRPARNRAVFVSIPYIIKLPALYLSHNSSLS